MVYDHHTHTIYSHGKGSIEDNVRVAAARGLKSVAVTDHGPGHLTYGLKTEKLPEMRREIARLKTVYPQVEVLLGVEANTIRVEPYLDVHEENLKEFDIILAGYHFGILKAGMIPNYISSHTGLMSGSSSGLLVRNTDMILHILFEFFGCNSVYSACTFVCINSFVGSFNILATEYLFKHFRHIPSFLLSASKQSFFFHSLCYLCFPSNTLRFHT